MGNKSSFERIKIICSNVIERRENLKIGLMMSDSRGVNPCLA